MNRYRSAPMGTYQVKLERPLPTCSLRMMLGSRIESRNAFDRRFQKRFGGHGPRSPNSPSKLTDCTSRVIHSSSETTRILDHAGNSLKNEKKAPYRWRYLKWPSSKAFSQAYLQFPFC